ncbi:MAG: squalene/phytoene synthase family protein, partial [Candidatus Micrarchaeia archaeon]
ICWNILPKVSRSFSFCIRMLPKPLDEQMMAAYLSYRILDTIEDSHAPIATKRRLFGKFLSLLSARAFNSSKISTCREDLLASLDFTYEADLLSNLDAVMRTYYSQPFFARRSILKWGRVMADGMYKFQRKPIETFKDQDEYSYHVAGVIGHLFTDLLFFNGIVGKRLRRKLTKYASHFGLALQKVNILRDIAADVIGKRHYWPRRLLARYNLTYESICLRENRKAAMKVLRLQIANARIYLRDAMKYIKLLPKNALKVRKFCLIPLFMAIESYVKCANSSEVFDSGKKVKISRLQVGAILAKVGLWCSSNDKLSDWFLQSMVRADSAALPAPRANQ